MSPPFPFMATSSVALGGAIGAVLRHQMGRGMTHWLGVQAVTAFPWATLAVNVVGLLGGFTTFSSFSLEMMMLIERGQALQALTYALISVLAGLTALYVGLIVMRVAA